MLAEGFIFIQRNWLSSNSLLLKNNKESILVDSGYSTHADLTLSVLEQHLAGQNLDKLLNTHLHSDHCGGNSVLQHRFPLLQVHVPAGQFEQVNLWDSASLSYELTGQVCQPFVATHRLEAGSTIELIDLSWQVIASPGHDSDSLMLFQPDHRVLVSADALWESGMAVIFPAFSEQNAFDEALLTFDLIEQLDPLVVIPGHGNVFSDVKAALRSARKKVSQFANDPRYHALYSAKVLIKFKLMEYSRVSPVEFLTWCHTTPLLLNIHHQFFSHYGFNDWITSLMDELYKRGNIQLEDDFIVNR